MNRHENKTGSKDDDAYTEDLPYTSWQGHPPSCAIHYPPTPKILKVRDEGKKNQASSIMV